MSISVSNHPCFPDVALWKARMTDSPLCAQDRSKSAPHDIASGMPLLVTAADRRARAVYYSFTLLCIGLAVLLVVILVESHRWRTTITNESTVSFILRIKTCRSAIEHMWRMVSLQAITLHQDKIFLHLLSIAANVACAR